MIALTGPEAAKARQKAKLLENRCEGVRVTVTDAKLPQKELVRLITELNDDISQATISHWKKEELRTRDGCASLPYHKLSLQQFTNVKKCPNIFKLPCVS